MSYQSSYDPVAMAAYLDASGADAIDPNGMTMGGAPAAGALTVAGRGSYGLSVGGSGTALCIVGLCAAVYALLHWDRLRGLGA